MLGDVLNWIGTALQLAGLAAAGLGVYGARRDYAPERLGVLGSLRRAAGSLWRIIAPLIRTVLRRPPPSVTAHVQTADDVGVAESAFVEVGYGEFSPGLGVEERLAQLDRRTRDIQLRANQAAAALRNEQAERKRETRELRDALVQQDAARDDSIKHAMTDDLTLQAWGLGVTAVGTLIAALA
jgi:hypothetical protein